MAKDVLHWLTNKDPFLVSHECCFRHLFPTDNYDVDDIPFKCPIHDAVDEETPVFSKSDGIPPFKGGPLAPFLADNLLSLTKTTGIVNFHVIRHPRAVRGSQTDSVIHTPYSLSKSTGIAYQFVRDLGMPEEYFDMIQKQIYKTLPRYREVPPCKEVTLTRVGDRVGMVMKCYRGPFGILVFVIFVVFHSPAHTAGIRFGDQILELEGRFLDNKRVLDRLLESPCPNVSIMIRQNPFRKEVCLFYPEGSTNLQFTTSQGCIVYVEEGSEAQRRGLEVDHQITEIDGECVVGIKDGQIKRAVFFNSQMRKNNTVTLTIMPQRIFLAYYKNKADLAEIRRKILSAYM